MRRHRRLRAAVAADERAASRPFGVGHAPAHHGELLQGVFDDGAGRLTRGLVTLPQPAMGTRAVFHPSECHIGVVGTPELTKVRRAALLTLREFTTHPGTTKGGRVEITSNVPRGVGMGSSTSDVTATIRAVADFHGVTLSREEVGRLAVLAECASDSIMIDDRVVLFAHRDGVVLETLGRALPPMVVVGCDTDPGGAGVDTLRLRPADYDSHDAGCFQVLRAALRRAVVLGDVALLGRVATASARLNQRHLPNPAFELLLALSAELGGHGVQVAHSGTVAGIVFDAAMPGVERAVEACVARLDAAGLPLSTVIGASPVSPDPAVVAAEAASSAGATAVASAVSPVPASAAPDVKVTA